MEILTINRKVFLKWATDIKGGLKNLNFLSLVKRKHFHLGFRLQLQDFHLRLKVLKAEWANFTEQRTQLVFQRLLH